MWSTLFNNVNKAGLDGEEEVPLRIDYVKGHMGGNLIILLDGRQVPSGKELEVALEVLEPFGLCGHEVGLLYPPRGHGDIRVRIVGYSSKDFITACGGLTQVLGKVIVETNWGKRFNVAITPPVTALSLETEAGTVPIFVQGQAGRAERVLTDMTAFVEECYSLGTYPIDLGRLNAMKVGKFLVLNADDVRARYPSFDLSLVQYETKRILAELQKKFQELTSPKNIDFALYDLHPSHSGNARVVFPHGALNGHIEPTCGTGTVAIGIAMLERGEFPSAPGKAPQEGTIAFECGGDIGLGGSELSFLQYAIAGGRLVKALFSHERIEVISEGFLRLETVARLSSNINYRPPKNDMGDPTGRTLPNVRLQLREES